MSDRLLRRSIAVLVFIISLTVYVMTMAVTTSFWDSGEFVATSYILGIPHSPGTPLYVLVGRVFCLLPLAISPAQKVNLLSAVFAALGVLMAYMVISAVIRFMFEEAKSAVGKFVRYAGPAVGAFFLTFSDTYWTDATEAEVYALSAFVMGLCTLLALKWLKNPTGKLTKESRERILAQTGGDEGKAAVMRLESEGAGHSRNLVYMIIYLLSLGIGFHLGTIIVYGGIFLLFLMIRKKAFTDFEILIFTFGLAVMVADMTLHRQSSLTIVGLVIFACLVIWSTLSSSRFTLNATALFILGISVHLFLYIRSGLDPIIDEVDPETWRSLYAHLRREQYPPINVFARKASIVFQLRHFWTYFSDQFRLLGDIGLGSFNIGRATVVLPTALGIYGVISNFTREKKSWVLNFTNLALNSIGLIIFLNFSDSEVRERAYFYSGAFYFFSIFIGIGATAFLIATLEKAEKAKSHMKKVAVIAGVVLIALSITPATHHWHTHDRSRNFIPRDYAYNMLVALEPDAIIFTNGDNDTFPLWYIQTVENFRTDVRVVNQMLLNTDWYIKQIRDEEPRVPISLTDVEIASIRPLRAKDGIWLKSDLAIRHILQQNNWKRPIYFATTTAPGVWQRYEEHLELEGMARRLVPYKGKAMFNAFIVERSFDSLYEFRGVLTEDRRTDNSVYKRPDVKMMFWNFALSASQMAVASSKRNDLDEAVKWAELSYYLQPDYRWARKYLGLHYIWNNQPKKAIEHFTREIARDPGNGEYWVGLAGAYERDGRLEKAFETLREGAVRAPEHRQVFGNGFRVAGSLGRGQDAINFIKNWIDRHPEDKELMSLYRDIDRVLYDEFGIGAPPDSGMLRKEATEE